MHVGMGYSYIQWALSFRAGIRLGTKKSCDLLTSSSSLPADFDIAIIKLKYHGKAIR